MDMHSTFNRMTINTVPDGNRQANGIKNAAVYCRVSKLSEAQEESYETQCAAYKKMISNDPKLDLVRIYGDQGISGATAKHRPEFQQMLEDCRNGKIDVVMTKSISRFARNLADCMEAVRMLRELNIPVLFEREGIDTMSNSGEMLLAVLASIAQEEINNMSQNIRWSQEQNNAVGNPVIRARYGYRKERDCAKHKWVIYNPEARRVRFAFEKADDGWKYWQILGGLDTMEAAEGTGVKWTYERLYGLLRSEVYIGDILTNKSIKPDYLQKRSLLNHGQRPQYYIEGHHDALIDKAQFERVSNRVKNHELKAENRTLPLYRKKPSKKKKEETNE
ncbi:MAG: recombinase family protein [Saccharofermentanales bacterium]